MKKIVLSHDDKIRLIRLVAETSSVTEARFKAKISGFPQKMAMEMYTRIEAVRHTRIANNVAVHNAGMEARERDFPTLKFSWRNLLMFDGIVKGIPVSQSYAERRILPTIAAAAVAKNRNYGSGDVTIKGHDLVIAYRDEQEGTYKGQWKGRPVMRRWVDVTLPENWLRRGMRVRDVDGIATFMPREADHLAGDIELRRCWIIGTKGAKRCVLASRGGLHYHGETVRKAVAGLRRKAKNEEQLKSIMSILRDEQGPNVRGITATTPITRRLYAQITGACQLGMEEFCREHGLEGRRSVPAGELLAMMPEGTWGRDVLQSLIENSRG